MCEAYEVLSDQQRKEIYDKYGLDGLKNGKPTAKEEGKTIGGYEFQGNSFQIFEQFYGCRNPFTDSYYVEDATNKKAKDDPEAPKDIEVVLSCSIFEFYNGSLKSFTYDKEALQPDNRTVEKVEENMTIEVKPGYDVDTVLVYPTRGNQAYAHPQSALRIKFKLDNSSVNEQNFKREGDNLIYIYSLTLEDALLSKPLQLRTLDGRAMNINIDKMITPQTVHVVPGEGMPKKSNTAQRGDMHIKFNITFPLNFKAEYKNAIVDILKKSQ